MSKSYPSGTRVVIVRSDLYRGKAGTVVGRAGATLTIRLDTGGQVNLRPGAIRREAGR